MNQPWQVISALETHDLRVNKQQIIQAQAQAGSAVCLKDAGLFGIPRSHLKSHKCVSHV